MSTDLKAKLAQLKELHDLELLTDEDFKEQKRALLAAALGTTPAPSSAPALAGATTVGAPPRGSAPPTASADPLSGPTTADPTAGLPSRLGNYRVLGVIGAGGMGTVVRARHMEEGWAQQQGGDVAIKLIHPEIASDDAFRIRFFAEAALGRRVQHPGLATVYDVVSEGPWLGTILEHVEGEELTAWIKPGGLPLEEVLALLTPLAEALDHLHSQGIVHRDLKPANVKVRPDGRPVLLDLGIAKDLSGQSGGQTQTMTTMGTSAWMAPEQADAKSVTSSADVYALGLIAYALLSGRMPWGEDESELRILANKMTGRLVPLAEVCADGSASDAVMAALSADEAARPESCGELVSRLGVPKVADLPSLVARLGSADAAVQIVTAGALTRLAASDRILRQSHMEEEVDHCRILGGRFLSEPITSRDAIREAGGIPPLVGLLRSSEPAVQDEAAGALDRIAADNPRNKDAIREAGGIPVLVGLLDSTAATIQQKAAGTLARLAVNNNTNQYTIRRAGGIRGLVALLDSPTSTVQHEAAEALRHLSANDTNKNTIRENGGIPHLVALLGSRETAVQEIAAKALARLANNDANKDAIVEAGGIPGLVSLLSSADPGIQGHAVRAIGRLARNNEINLDSILEAMPPAGLEILVALSGSDDSTLRGHASKALGEFHNLLFPRTFNPPPPVV